MKIPPQRAQTATRETIEQPLPFFSNVVPNVDICMCDYALELGQVIATQEGYRIVIIEEVTGADYSRAFPRWYSWRLARYADLNKVELHFYRFHAD